jgi:hypothetical protein
MAGVPGKLVRIGQWANGNGFQDYQHVLGYAGYFHKTPEPGLRNGKPVPMVGTGAGHYVIEAMPGGARLRRLDGRPENIPGSLWSSGKIEVTPQERDRIWQAAWGYLGTPYSALDYFALATKRLHLFPADELFKHYVETNKHMICSQYYDRCYRDGGVELFTDKRWDGDVTPLDLAHRIEAG